MERKEDLRAIFPALKDDQFRQLQQFCLLVKDRNSRINLVSRQDTENLWEHHVLPSVAPLCMTEIPEQSRVCDIGSGGGFPAIPLKILRPDLEILLTDSIRKKALFLKQVIEELNLENITVQNERVETLGKNPGLQQQFDFITARAVGKISALMAWGRPFLKESGSFLFWKGESDIPELERHAGIWNYQYQILSIPPEFWPLSSKFKDLRWFLVREQFP